MVCLYLSRNGWAVLNTVENYEKLELAWYPPPPPLNLACVSLILYVPAICWLEFSSVCKPSAKNSHFATVSKNLISIQISKVTCCLISPLYFENFDFTSKFEGGSSSCFATVFTFIRSRSQFDFRRWLAILFYLCFENFNFTLKF